MKINWKIAENQSPVISYRSAQWNGIGIKHWNVLAGDLEETVDSDHDITLRFKGRMIGRRHSQSGHQEVVFGTPGQICIVPSGQPFALSWEEEIECMSMMLEPQLLNRIAQEFSNQTIELQGSFDSYDPLIWQIGMALMAESAAKEPVGKMYAESLANTLAFHLFRNYSIVGKKAKELTGGLTGRRLKMATEFINDHLSNDLTLSEIADVVDLSPYHFARAFKRTTGLTPQQYLMQRRIEQAKKLLAREDLPIVEISAQVGFKNQSHFTTFFRRITSTTPKAWREMKLS